MSKIPTVQDLERLNDNAVIVDEVVNSDQDRSSTAPDGKTKLTLAGLENAGNAKITDMQAQTDAALVKFKNDGDAKIADVQTQVDNTIASVTTKANEAAASATAADLSAQAAAASAASVGVSYPFSSGVLVVDTTEFTPPQTFQKAYLSINGVSQIQGDAFNVVNNKIVFTDPVPAGLVVHGLVKGD